MSDDNSKVPLPDLDASAPPPLDPAASKARKAKGDARG